MVRLFVQVVAVVVVVVKRRRVTLSEAEKYGVLVPLKTLTAGKGVLNVEDGAKVERSGCRRFSRRYGQRQPPLRNTRAYVRASA